MQEAIEVSRLFHVNTDQLSKFRTRLAKAGGHLRVAVHPRFLTYNAKHVLMPSRTATQDQINDATNMMEEGFQRTLKSVTQREHSSPIIVFEERKRRDLTKRHAATHTTQDTEALAEAGVLFLPTLPGCGTVDIREMNPELSDAQSARANELEAAISTIYDRANARKQEQRAELRALLPPMSDWDFCDLDDGDIDRLLNGTWLERDQAYSDEIAAIHNTAAPYRKELHTLRPQESEVTEIEREYRVSQILSVLGVQSAVVMGAYLEAYTTQQGKTVPSRCAGTVLQMLRDFNVPTDISRFVWFSRERARRAGIEIKQTHMKKS